MGNKSCGNGSKNCNGIAIGNPNADSFTLYIGIDDYIFFKYGGNYRHLV